MKPHRLERARKLELVSARSPEEMLQQRQRETWEAWLGLCTFPWSHAYYSIWTYAIERLHGEWMRYFIATKGR
jgi:hypothetical protein